MRSHITETFLPNLDSLMHSELEKSEVPAMEIVCIGERTPWVLSLGSPGCPGVVAELRGTLQ